MEQLPFGLHVATNTLAMLIGISLFFIALVSMFRTIVIPRSLNSTLSHLVMMILLAITGGLARMRRTYRSRDAIQAWAGPSYIFIILVTWLGLFILAYGFMIFAASPEATLADGIRQSGSSLLTLGFAAGQDREQTIIDFIAAATGPIVIALMIGVLPTIYTLYLSREQLVTGLENLAGGPAWGPELLTRSAMSNRIDDLPATYARWSDWSDSLRMSALTYPVLIYMRSSSANRHYVVALLAVMDAAALHLSLTTKLPRSDAFLLILNGSTVLERIYERAASQRSVASALPLVARFKPSVHPVALGDYVVTGITPQMQAMQTAAARDALRELTPEEIESLKANEHRPLELTRDDFAQAYAMITASGFPVERDVEDAWETFQHIRSRYEFPAYELTRILDATPAPWTGTRARPTPTMWPNLAVSILENHTEDVDAPTAASPDDSSTPPGPDAAHP